MCRPPGPSPCTPFWGSVLIPYVEALGRRKDAGTHLESTSLEVTASWPAPRPNFDLIPQLLEAPSWPVS